MILIIMLKGSSSRISSIIIGKILSFSGFVEIRSYGEVLQMRKGRESSMTVILTTPVVITLPTEPHTRFWRLVSIGLQSSRMPNIYAQHVTNANG